MAAERSRNVLLSALALVAIAVVMVWMLVIPPGEQETAEAAHAPPESPAPAPAAPEPNVEPPAAAPPQAPAPEPQRGHSEEIDFFAGEMPDFMAEAHLRVLDKKWLGAPVQKQLYEFGQEHEDDARPQLLLAWDSMNRKWDGFAVRLYRMAYRADPRAKQVPSMLRDLLDIASRRDRTEYRETVALVKEAYGEEALPAIDEKLAQLRHAGKLEGAARLQRLRDKLTAR